MIGLTRLTRSGLPAAAQGDMERAAGLPISPMCDRTKAGVAQSQVNFIEFVVAPLYVQVSGFLVGR